jgi:CheY-like chemotaxis protein
MSEQKRVLVVDDSKSARLVLRRMLEKYSLHVDTVESASLALDFLAHNRPDAIFMDHMMPGMDGFQAVKAIKANPRTATIPVMMYTSKGGDLYIGQARALGAVGVLPKTVAPAQLFESLRKIGVVNDRRSEDRTLDEDGASERAEDIEPRHAPPPPRKAFSEPGMAQPDSELLSELLDQHLRHLLEEQRVELRKDILLSMETVARQTSTRLHKELDDSLEQRQAGERESLIPAPVPLTALAVLLAVSLLTNLYLFRDRPEPVQAAGAADSSALSSRLASLSDEIDGLESLQTDTLTRLHTSWNTASWAMNQSLQYDYDEIALDDQRVDLIESLLTRLTDSGFGGKLLLQTHAGEFCLLGDEEKGFRLPPPELPVDQCDYIGNPVQAVDTPSAHQSLRFANFISSTPLLSDGSISLEVTSLPRDEPLVAYPEKSADTTAQAWNQAAQANNRVTVSVVLEQDKAGNTGQ